ncbi:MAG: hypothetical protein ACC654_01400 [Acidimicrobiia bacterium]
METPLDTGDDLVPPPDSVGRYVALSLFGLLLIIIGVAADYVLDANNPGLTVYAGLFSVNSLGHLILGIGIVATAVGLALAASKIINTAGGDSGILRFGRFALGIGLVVLVVSLVYVVTGPGLGNSHSNGVSDALILSDGVDRSRLPAEEALALATLAWSRPGSLAEDAGMVHMGMEDDMESTVADQGPGSERALADQLALATGALARLDTIAEVEAQGYVQASNVSDGSGAHWVKWTLVDKPFDPENPSMLLFDQLTRGEPMELIAYSYWVASDGPPEGFPGTTDEWHPHVGMCFQNGWLKDDNLPDRRSCAGDWVNGSDLWMLHAWIVPGVENDFGQFATVNPLLCERACGLEN